MGLRLNIRMPLLVSTCLFVTKTFLKFKDIKELNNFKFKKKERRLNLNH